jgi:hypothetical protein
LGPGKGYTRRANRRSEVVVGQSHSCLDTSHHGLPHPFKDARVVADSLTGIHNAMVKCLFDVNGSCIHKGF